jgi:hypothetical protein
MSSFGKFATITHSLLGRIQTIWPFSHLLNRENLPPAVPEDISGTTYFQLTQKSLETLREAINHSDWNNLDAILKENSLPETLKALVALALDSTFDENNKTIGNPLAPRQIDRETRGYLNTITSHVADRLNDLLMGDKSREEFLNLVNSAKGHAAFPRMLKDLLGGQTLLDFETLLTELTPYVPESSATYTKATTVLGDLKMLQDIVAEEEKDKTSENPVTLQVLANQDPRQERA